MLRIGVFARAGVVPTPGLANGACVAFCLHIEHCAALGSNVEAGAGLGVVTESVLTPTPALRFVLLKPGQSVPLVFVWREDEDSPAVQRFRELLLDWERTGKLWPARGI